MTEHTPKSGRAIADAADLAEISAIETAQGRVEDPQRFAYDYVRYLEDLPALRFPDLPPLNAEAFADAHADEYRTTETRLDGPGVVDGTDGHGA